MSNAKIRKHWPTGLEVRVDDEGNLYVSYAESSALLLKSRQRPAFEQWLRRTADWSEEDRERKADRRKR